MATFREDVRCRIAIFTMQPTRIFVFLLTAAAAIGVALAQSRDCGPRVRRPYHSLTTAERTLLKNAFELAMQRGHHHRFTTVHQYSKNEYEAHSCMFTYWHRRFLLGYENMLRSLGDAYACLTIPYWDYAGTSSSFLDKNNTCNSLASCNPVLVEYGASRQVNASRYSVGGSGQPNDAGEPIDADNCIVDPTQPATRSYCESEAAFQAGKCQGCIPRGNWFAAGVSSEMTLASMSNQIFATSLSKFTQNVMLKMHPKVHANLNGAMGSMASPSDPVFFFHHATVDALLAIYMKCQASNASPMSSLVFPANDWGTFNNRVCGPYVFRPTTSAKKFKYPSATAISMVYYNGTTGDASFDVGDTNSPLAPFFQDLPPSYTAYYNYPPSARVVYDFSNTGFQVLNDQCTAWLGGDYGASSSSSSALLDERRHRPQKETKGPPTAVVTQIAFTQKLYKHTRRYVRNETRARDYVEMMLCVHRNECLGGVFDYSDAFKASFRFDYSPYCYDVLHAIASGDKTIPVPKWTQIVLDTYGCHVQSTSSLI
ncbi:Aste57867_12278 [Aphanomyces stellatus]|uniref:Aste57867_12278 protein n=1 Tax=Aphanomyces stellatus TaxID=120398 RepID=A0A485KVJ9_9STRA|nr:hypothetical protein As57867_012233 [Aphanomyces stellatus]VFT89131.1 Aste57867_12278 [Aphanomyces stellatus]